jgi:hypothetical protein
MNKYSISATLTLKASKDIEAYSELEAMELAEDMGVDEWIHYIDRESIDDLYVVEVKT